MTTEQKTFTLDRAFSEICVMKDWDTPRGQVVWLVDDHDDETVAYPLDAGDVQKALVAYDRFGGPPFLQCRGCKMPLVSQHEWHPQEACDRWKAIKGGNYPDESA